MNRVRWVISVVILAVVAAGCRYQAAQMASTVTAQSVRRVTIGMTERDLLEILGPAPLRYAIPFQI